MKLDTTSMHDNIKSKGLRYPIYDDKNRGNVENSDGDIEQSSSTRCRYAV